MPCSAPYTVLAVTVPLAAVTDSAYDSSVVSVRFSLAVSTFTYREVTNATANGAAGSREDTPEDVPGNSNAWYRLKALCGVRIKANLATGSYGLKGFASREERQHPLPAHVTYAVSASDSTPVATNESVFPTESWTPRARSATQLHTITGEFQQTPIAHAPHALQTSTRWQ